MSRNTGGQPARDLAVALRSEQEELTEAITQLCALLGKVPRRAVGRWAR